MHKPGTPAESTAGSDHIGVGVGALVFNDAGHVFLARRGPAARNEPGTWEFPGGAVDFGERLADATRREFREEYGMEIRITGQLGAFDHILDDEEQHWISVTYIARSIGPDPRIREPDKCAEIGWFDIADLPTPLSRVSKANAAEFARQHPPVGPA